jgi:hypothetical protein
MLEEFEDNKGVIRIHKSKKERQHNGQKDKQRSTKYYIKKQQIFILKIPTKIYVISARLIYNLCINFIWTFQGNCIGGVMVSVLA